MITPLISVVDDDHSVRESLARLIRSVGFRVQLFESAEDFLGETAGRRADCLLLDVRMPGMNGLNLQRELSATDRDLPVIFITAHDEAGVRDRALAAGAVAFLRKPFNDELFIKTLRVALKEDTGE